MGALLFSIYAYHNFERYFSWIGIYGGTYPYDIVYDDFGAYFTDEFFSSRLMYGYILLVSLIAFVASFIVKKATEGCEITVTNEAIFGKLSRNKDVNIPLNQITAINRSSFNGVSVASIGNVSNFYCIENRDEVMKAISYLLTNSQQAVPQANSSESAATATSGEAEQLMRLKDLLDNGVLTQEEFDAKKKQILGV